MGLISYIKELFHYRSELTDKVEHFDKESRDMKHQLRNLAMRSHALHKLVSHMREDEAWRQGRRQNDQRN